MQGLSDRSHPFFKAQPRGLMMANGDSNNEPIGEPGSTFRDVNVATRDRIKRPGIDCGRHRHYVTGWRKVCISFDPNPRSSAGGRSFFSPPATIRPAPTTIM